MSLLSRLTAAAVLVGALVASDAALASDQSEVVADATRTAEHMKHDPAFGQARQMLSGARAVLIVPGLVKGGFIFGAEGGSGVLLARTHKSWSYPAFYTMASASFGLQIGLEKAEIVLLIMSDRALRAIERSQFKFGADAGLTVVTLSAGAEGATAPNLSGDIIVWTSATGAYGGLTLNGSILKPRDEWNESYYGKPVRVPQILSGSVKNPDAKDLRAEIASVW
jgi:lipid-binding SYLF domain-containing protein